MTYETTSRFSVHLDLKYLWLPRGAGSMVFLRYRKSVMRMYLFGNIKAFNAFCQLNWVELPVIGNILGYLLLVGLNFSPLSVVSKSHWRQTLVSWYVSQVERRRCKPEGSLPLAR